MVVARGRTVLCVWIHLSLTAASQTMSQTARLSKAIFARLSQLIALALLLARTLRTRTQLTIPPIALDTVLLSHQLASSSLHTNLDRLAHLFHQRLPSSVLVLSVEILGICQ